MLKLTLECLEDLFEIHASVVLVGDWNFPDIDWADVEGRNHIFPQDSNDDNDKDPGCQALFLDFVRRSLLHQFVTSATRNDKILDLVLTNDPFVITNVFCDTSLSTSDHNTVCFNVLFGSHEAPYINNRVVFNYKLADWQSLTSALSAINWSDRFKDCCSGEELWSTFHGELLKIIDSFVPKQNSKNSNYCNQSRIPKHIIKIGKKKNFLWKKLRHFRTAECKIQYKNISHEYREAIMNHLKKKKRR